MKKLLIPILCSSYSFLALAQNDSVSTSLPKDSTTSNSFIEMNLEDLMNVKIVSASREAEKSFDAPLTSCVITRQEINSMGATSIPDALRFCPGIIVREVSNGSYDVSIRGGVDGLPSYQYQNVNTTILAMIDNRPVFSTFQGGTFWQNLPVELVDVERIEIVYGPNSPMYGPNAVSGVINIITRKEHEARKTTSQVNIQRGVSNIMSAYIGHKLNDQLEISISANTTTRTRTVEEYYDANTDSYVNDIKKLSPIADETYPLRENSLKKTGANFNAYYTPSKKVFVNYNSTYNTNQAYGQLQATTSLNVLSNTSNSHMLRAELYNFTFQSSILYGNQGLIGNNKAFSHDYTTQDNYLDYNLKLFKKLSIRPALSYQNAAVNDKKYTVDKGTQGLFNSSASVETMSASLKADYKVFNWLRLVGAVRADKLSKPDEVYPSYQLSANVKPVENHMFRASAGRSFNGGFIVPTFANFTGFNGQVGGFSTNLGPAGVYQTDIYYILNLRGGPTRKLLQNDMIEVGYRGQISKNVQVDLSLYNQTFQNFSVFTNQKSVTDIQYYPGLPLPSKITSTQESVIQNLDMIVKQNGASFALTFVTNNKLFSVKPHITIQETKVKDYQKYYYVEGANDTRPGLDLSVKEDVYSQGTPSWYGGFTLNMVPIKRVNVGLSGYYYDQTYMTTLAGQSATGGGVTKSTINDKINDNGIFNFHVSYKVHENISLGLNARNILDNRSRQVWGGDQIGSQFFATLIVEY